MNKKKYAPFECVYKLKHFLLDLFVLLNSCVLLFLLLVGCKNIGCPKNKLDFLQEHNDLIKAIKTRKHRYTDEYWNHFDARIKRNILECSPRYITQLDTLKQRRYWRHNMGYLYSRYGLKLLKKFKQTDITILRVKEGLHKSKALISAEIDSLATQWPVLVNLDPYTKEQLVRIFKVKQRYFLIPSDSSLIIRDIE